MDEDYLDIVPSWVERRVAERLGVSLYRARKLSLFMADTLNRGGREPIEAHDIVMTLALALFSIDDQEDYRGQCRDKSAVRSAAPVDVSCDAAADPHVPAKVYSISDPAFSSRTRAAGRDDAEPFTTGSGRNRPD